MQTRQSFAEGLEQEIEMTDRDGIAVVIKSMGWVVVVSGLGQWLALGSIGWGLIAIGGLLVAASEVLTR